MFCLIVCEKPSAAKNFSAALGGMEGSFDGERYKIVSLRGHVMKFAEPEQQVLPELSQRYSKWALDALPWDISKMSFKRVVDASAKDVFDVFARAVKAMFADDELVIATDTDPSGEGELIAWEALDACGFDAARNRVSRMLFVDEAPESIRGAFKNRVPIASKDSDGDYLKAEARSRWDFLSMQLTRAATLHARFCGYRGVIRVGRLKSVMVSEVGRQLEACKSHKKTPFFEVRFKDDAGHVFKQTSDKAVRFDAADKIDVSMAESAIIEDAVEVKSKPPDKLLDLAGLSAILVKRGFTSSEVLSTYQKMYEAKIVSYPRTEDKTITPAQFDEFLGIADTVAVVVGVDAALLTHRSPRKTHVKAQGAHGANRPGAVVPKSLEELTSFGKCAGAIYELLAKSCLSMLAEDYEYECRSAHLELYPDFKASFNVVINSGFKAIFGASDTENADCVLAGTGDGEAESLCEDADSEAGNLDENASGRDEGFKGSAKPYVYKGFNKAPATPTMEWLIKRLENYDVGTGATRTSTFADITEGKDALMTSAKGRLSLTDSGSAAYILLAGSRISDASATEELFLNMNRVGKFELEPSELVYSITPLIEHDMAKMADNAAHLPLSSATKIVGVCPICGADVIKRGQVFVCIENTCHKNSAGEWENTGNCSFRLFASWCGAKLTDKQISSLLAGKAIALKGCKSKSGKSFDCKISLDGGHISPIFDKKCNKDKSCKCASEEQLR